MKGDRISRFCFMQLVLTPSQTKCTMSVLEVFQRCEQEKSNGHSGVRNSCAVIVITFSLTPISDQVLGHVDTDLYMYLAKTLILTPGLCMSHKMHI